MHTFYYKHIKFKVCLMLGLDKQKFSLYEVTSSLTVKDWLQMAMEEFVIQKQNGSNKKLFSQQKIIDEPSNIKRDDLLFSHIIVLDGKPTINFHDQRSIIALTKCFLTVLFGIKWTLPQSNLCPRIPNRLNYLIWIYRFVIGDGKQPKYIQNKNNCILGIDIGTGASLIYPLIGHKLFGWKFIATETDQESIRNCMELIRINEFQGSIRLIRGNSSFILKGCIQKDAKIDFLMCNPPFFDTQSLLKDPLSKMTNNQHNVCGGQYQFFFSLYMQSFQFTNIDFFTLMIGLGRDFQEIKHFLTEQYERYQVLEWVRFGKINQSENTRFIVAWRVNRQKNRLVHTK